MTRHADMKDRGSDDWLDLTWSAWMPLMAAHPLALAQLPSGPGIYRIRRAGSSHNVCWIGPAPNGVRETVERLSRQVHLPVQPYDDPTSPAVHLWQEATTNSIHFEVSGAEAHSGTLCHFAGTPAAVWNQIELMHRTGRDR